MVEMYLPLMIAVAILAIGGWAWVIRWHRKNNKAGYPKR